MGLKEILNDIIEEYYIGKKYLIRNKISKTGHISGAQKKSKNSVMKP